jgi:hypothetical protein
MVYRSRPPHIPEESWKGLVGGTRAEHRRLLQRVQAMPPRPGPNGVQRTAGAQSSFNFGRGVGVIDGICGALQLRVTYPTPQKWKKRAGLIGKDKDQARTRALELYPHLDLHRKKDVGRADAILIAHYGSE